MFVPISFPKEVGCVWSREQAKASNEAERSPSHSNSVVYGIPCKSSTENSTGYRCPELSLKVHGQTILFSSSSAEIWRFLHHSKSRKSRTQLRGDWRNENGVSEQSILGSRAKLQTPYFVRDSLDP